MGERKRRRGNKKGTPFEREICKKLSEWWTEGRDDGVFWRTSQSGGWSTTRAKAGKKGSLHCSDLCAVDPVGEPLLKLTIVEMKKGYHKHTIHDLLDCPDKSIKKEYEEWIGKAERDKERAGAFFWILIHMRDRREPMVFMPVELMNSLLAEGAMEETSEVHLCMSVRGLDICGTTLKEFLGGTNHMHIISVLGRMISDAHERVSSTGS